MGSNLILTLTLNLILVTTGRLTHGAQPPASVSLHSILELDHELRDPSATVCQLASSATTAPAAKTVVFEESLEQLAREAAPYLAPLGFRACTKAKTETTLGLDASTPVWIVLRPDAKPVPYYGRRNVATLVRVVKQLEQRLAAQPFQVITSKLDRKAFGRIAIPKVLAYFPDPTAPLFVQFQEAASLLAPNPPFFVVHDPTMAAKYRLTTPGQMALVRRLEKSSMVYTPSDAASTTAAHMVEWINANRGLVLHELDDSNLYDPEVSSANSGKYLLVAVADQTTSLGLYLHKLIMKTIQNVTRENELVLHPELRQNEDSEESEGGNEAEVEGVASSTLAPPITGAVVPLDDIEIVWVDLGRYPHAGAKIAQLAAATTTTTTTSGPTATASAWFALLNPPEGTGAKFFDLGTLNTTTTDRSVLNSNLATLLDWILTVTNRNPNSNLESPSSSSISFVLEPEPVTARLGSSFVLDCKVSGLARPVQQCAWTRNGHPIDIGSQPYLWLSPDDPTDCSFTVSGANAIRDTGAWRCVVVENNVPLVHSKAAQVKVREANAPLPVKAEL